MNGGDDGDLLYINFDTVQTIDLSLLASLTGVEALEFDTDGNPWPFLVINISGAQALSLPANFSLTGSEPGVVDVLTITASGATTLDISGWELSAWTGNDRVALIGSTGADNFVGTGGIDSLFGGDGVDVLSAGSGADFIIANAALAGESYNGGADLDTLIVERAPTAVIGGVYNGYYMHDYTAGTIISIERLNFGNPTGGLLNQLNSDKVARFSVTQVTTGLANNLNVFGVTGRVDVVEITGGGSFALSNWVFNNWGAEDYVRIVGGAGVDNVDGSTGRDIFEGGSGADNFYGDTGNDTFAGGAGIDTHYLLLDSNTATWTRNTSGSWTVTSADGTDTLTDVEFIMFNDRTLHLDRAVHNFHGDGTSDVLLRRSDGVTAIWDMEGATVTNADVTQYQAPTDWQIEGIGDFNADGRDDFLLRRDSDQVTAIWSMSGTQVLAADVTNWQAGSEWQIQGIGDFNSDGYDDIMWRRTDGVTAIWQLNGTTVASGDVTNWQAGNEWVIKGIGDFDGDGNDDLLLQRDSDGVIAMWQMDGATVTSGNITSQQAGLDWQIAGVGDFNGDGRDDLLLQRTSDTLVAVWTMNGANVTNASLTSSQTGFGWDVVGVGDYSGDGQDDILWRNGDGTLVVWTMDGPTVLSVQVTSAQVGNDWTVI